MVAAELAGRTTVADALARQLEARQAGRQGGGKRDHHFTAHPPRSSLKRFAVPEARMSLLSLPGPSS
jgi:hypothetical protein